jgi:pilus assembly protein CpaB
MVTSEESERLALSTDKGHILLALRGIGDEEHADTRGITPPVLLQATSAPEAPKAPKRIATGTRARPRRDPPRQEIPAAAARDRQVVEILRGDLYEKRAFDTQEKRP